MDSRLNVRICDSALSRDIFPGDYHRLGNGESRPVKWMAIESLTEGKYSTACDVVCCKFLISVKSEGLKALSRDLKSHVGLM